MIPRAIALDVETTGLPRDSHILELGLIGADRKLREIMHMGFYVHTDLPFEQWKEASEEVHGITPDDIEQAMTLTEVTRFVAPMLRHNPVIVGHNILGYDLEIIEGTALHYTLRGCSTCDTMKDVEYGTRKWMSLEKAADKKGIELIGEAHSAVDDARNSLRVAQAEFGTVEQIRTLKGKEKI